MRSIDVPPGLAAALDGLDAAQAAIGALNFEAYSPAVRLCALERMETSHRRQVALGHDVIAGLAKEIPPTSAARCTKWSPTGCGSAAPRPDVGCGTPDSFPRG
jgi:hypothetical protein